jgi:peptide/nickel transport system substrate-binding protein
MLTGAAPAVARALAPAGFRVTVREHAEGEFLRVARTHPTFFLTLFGCDTGDGSDLLLAAIHTPDAARHLGSANHGRFSDPDLDRAIEESLGVLSPGERRLRLVELFRRAEEQMSIVPLFFEEDVWAVKNGVRFTPRADSWVLCQEIGRE